MPLGAPKPPIFGVTVAVKATDWPNTELVGAAATVVVVSPTLTVKGSMTTVKVPAGTVAPAAALLVEPRFVSVTVFATALTLAIV